MSWLAWFWLVVLVLITIGGIRCIREVLAMSQHWTVIASKITKPMEGGHAEDQTSD